MTQELIDWWHGNPEFARYRDSLGMRMLEWDEDHTRVEIEATEFNKIRGYWTAIALLGVVESVAGATTNFLSFRTSAEAGELAGISWQMTQVNANLTGNTRGDAAICESRWSVRGDEESVVTTEIRSGDRSLLHATSTHRKRSPTLRTSITPTSS